MSARTLKNAKLTTLRNQKAINIMGWACTLLLILAPVIIYLINPHDFSLFITYLSDIRETPAWPQIGLFPTPLH
jgi:hypothetical protein